MSTWVSVPYWLAALIVIGNEPLTIGTPEIAAVAGSKLIPTGSRLQLKETGSLLAVIV